MWNFTVMKTLIGSLLAVLVVASAQGADTVIYAEDPRVDFILMKLRAAGTGKALRELATEEFRSKLSIPDGQIGQKRLATFVDDFGAQAETVDPAAIIVRRHVKLAIDHYDKEVGRFVFRNTAGGMELNQEIDYCSLFPEPFTGRRPTMPADYSAAERLARRAIPRQHKHNVPIPGPIG
jgi:hypothetical protein